MTTERDQIRVTQAKLNTICDLMTGVGTFCEVTSLMASTVIHLASEYERLQTSIKKHGRALNWDEFLDKMAKSDAFMWEQIKKIEVLVFDLGKLKGRVFDGETWTFVNFFSGKLKYALQEEYGVRFRVKIDQVTE